MIDISSALTSLTNKSELYRIKRGHYEIAERAALTSEV
jgi:predicted transcriptional regulator of viral defense system